MNNLSIRAKVFMISLLPILIMAVLLSGIYVWQRSNEINETLSTSVINTAEVIASVSELEIVSQNRPGLTRLLNSHVQNDNILMIQVTDHAGNQLAAARNNTYKQSTDITGIAQDDNLLVIKKPVIPMPVEIHDLPETHSPATNSIPIGYIIVTGTYRHAQQLKLDLLKSSLSLTLIAVLITVYLAYILAKQLITPLQTIVDTVRKLTDGKLTARNPEDHSGEIGKLQKNINAMATALAYSRELEKNRSDNLLYNEKSRAMTTLESLGEGVISTDRHGFITYINPAASRLTGYNSGDAIGQHLHLVFRTSNTTTFKQFDYPIQSCIEFGAIIRHDSLLRLTSRHGKEIIIRDTSTAIYDKNNTAIGAVLIFDDFTSLHSMAEKLTYQATHDDLTGLFNRREFENQLETTLHDISKERSEHVLCYVDLDQFKIINDTCGHAAGDELLRQLSQLIKGKIRNHDVLARLGGDEFGIILKYCQTDQAAVIANNILAVLANYIFNWNGKQHQVGASIGLVAINTDQFSLSDAMIAADSACYIAKDKGRNRVHVFTPTDTEIFKLHGAMQWFQHIKNALSQDTLELYVQPIYPSHANTITSPTHYEVLLRLHANGEIHMPDAFVATAERYNLMTYLDRWVISHAFALMRKYETHPATADVIPKFSINLSGQSIGHEDFHDYVSDAIQKYQINPANIVFEITETAAITNLSYAIAFMQKFRDYGCHFALDDFGSGLSSFGYLTSLPIDYIKIDGKLIKAIIEKPINLSIVEAINRIAHEMQLLTIAEYVETTEIMSHINRIGIDYAQGFALSQPRPIDLLFTPA